MCEFKIIRKNDNEPIVEDILVLSYTENNELVLKDILGMGEKLDSALILDVNTLNQTCVIIEHPIIKDFIGFMKNLIENGAKKEEIENLKEKLEQIKSNL